MFWGEGDAAIQPTTAGKKTGITKKLMAGRAMESHWPTKWVQASILERAEREPRHAFLGCFEKKQPPRLH